VPGTSKKNGKRPNSPQTPQRKPRKPRQASRPRPQKRGPRSAKKAKKGVSTPDILQAVLLTGLLIISAIIVSMGVLGIKQQRAAIAVPKPAAESASVQDEPPVRETEEPPPPVATPVATPVSKTTAEKVPEKATVKEPQNRQPTKAPATPATPTKKPAPKPEAVPQQTPVARTPASVPAAVIPEPTPKPKYQGTLAFVIDDAGNNLQELEPFLRFPGPLTIAVLPGLPHSAEAARRIRAAGKEVFLHQPMEAIGGQAPGPGAIYAGMTAAEVLAVLRQNIAEIGPVAGMNNHQGSKITADQQVMETILAFCREQGVYFLDSRTTAETAVPAAARNLGIKIGERNIFIDNEQDRASMTRYIKSGLTLASQKGSAVMIGHTTSPELAPLLTELYQNLTAQGYTFSTASALIK